MGFFSDIGEALFGTETKAAARKNTSESMRNTKDVGDQAKTYGKRFDTKRKFYDDAVLESTGGSADEFMSRAGTSAKKNIDEITKDARNTGLETGKMQSREAAAQGKAIAADQTKEATKSGLSTASQITGAAQESGLSAAERQQAAAQASASKLAEQQGQTAATQGTKAAMQAARTAGLSKGQAALTAGQQAGDIYTNNYQQGLQQGMQNYNQAAQNNISNFQNAAQQGSAQNLQASQNAASENLAAQQQAAAAYQQGKQQGIQNYGQATSQLAQQGSEMAGRQQGALNTQLGAATGQANIAQNQTTNAMNQASQTWGTIGTLAGAAAGLLSDENAKQNIQEVGFGSGKANKFNAKEMSEGLNKYIIENNPASNTFGQGLKTGQVIGKGVKSIFEKKDDEKLSDRHAKINVSEIIDIEDIAKKVRPVKFEYKPEIVAEGKAEDGEHLGVIAQDLEKTALAPVVKEGDDGLKRIDTAELSPAVLNLVIQLARKVEKLEGEK